MIRDMMNEEKPREKFITHGGRSLTMVELIAILLRTGCQKHSVMEIAEDVVRSFSCLQENGDSSVSIRGPITVDMLRKIKGIGTDKAVTLCAALELGRRMSRKKVKETYGDFKTPEAVSAYVMEDMRHETKEHFQIALLDNKCRLIGIEEISVGGLGMTIVESRYIFKKALLANASSIILIHNHPSGDPTPSEQDVKITKKMKDVGDIMNIPILDHVIIGDGDFVSLRREGLV